jgi:serine/threonine protein kinase
MEDPVTEKMVTTVCAHCGNAIDVTGLDPGDGITCPYCSKEFSVTRQFGNFLLARHLGSGGMGTVYLGHDMTLKREVAVKVLRPELVSDQKFMATFLREAEVTASLNHPNIVQVYAFGQHENVYYLVIEYISGGTLDDKITNRGRITELEGIEIGIAVARGLECALQRGLIHRDIKPGNILFNANNTPKVVDFGLSLSYETADHFDGEIWGTPYYVAPEKLERRPEDFRSDLYSLGATLFHAISGRPPYEGEDPNDVAMKHLSGKVVSLKSFVPDISDQTAYAVSKAMGRHPEDRYESYAAFISQLEDAKRRITDPNFRKHQQEKVVILGTSESAKYNGALIIGIVVIIVLLLGIMLWKGASFFEQKKSNVPALDMGDYAPGRKGGSVVAPSVPKATQSPVPAPIPKVTQSPVPAPVPKATQSPVPVPVPKTTQAPAPASPPPDDASTGDVLGTQRIRAENYNNALKTAFETYSGGRYVAGIVDGDYTEYNNINLDGKGAFEARVACANPDDRVPGAGGTINIRLDSPTGTLIGTCPVASTGGWQTWTTVTCNLKGASGTHNVYLVFTGPTGWLFNVEWFEFKQATQAPAPASPPPDDASTGDVLGTQRIRAENYNNALRTAFETYSGGRYVACILDGDYTEYNDINLDGKGTFEARVACANPDAQIPGVGGTINIRLDSPTGTLIGTCPVAPTGGWQNWTTVTCNLKGASGTHNVYLMFTGPTGWLFNMEWFEFKP